MKTYEGKTIMEALNNASKDLGIPVTVLKTKANIISHKKICSRVNTLQEYLITSLYLVMRHHIQI